MAPTNHLLVTLSTDDLRAIIGEAVAEHAKPATWLSLAQLTAEFGFSRESLASAARDGLNVHRGPRGRLMVRRADVEQWLSARPWTPPCPKQASPKSVDDPDAGFSAQLARLEVVR